MLGLDRHRTASRMAYLRPVWASETTGCMPWRPWALSECRRAPVQVRADRDRAPQLLLPLPYGGIGVFARSMEASRRVIGVLHVGRLA
jgi:hypothetical protein